MNKILVFFALMVLPLSAMAMSEASDQTLSDVTGQAGVSINANLTMDMSITTVAWGDPDGVGTDSAAGYIGIKNLDLKGITVNSQDTLATFQPITIDVATGHPVYGAGVTYVHYGLGTLKVGVPGQTIDIALGSSLGTDGEGLNQTLGESYMAISTIEFDPSSYVDIWAGNVGTPGVGSGVNQTLNISLKTFDLNTISWGDTDGLGAGSTAGFCGLSNLVLTTPDHPITVTGTMSINQGSKSLGGATPTVVHISYDYGDFVINVPGPITGTQVLSTTKDLTGSPQVLGDIYISSFVQTIKQGSYIDIYAH